MGPGRSWTILKRRSVAISSEERLPQGRQRKPGIQHQAFSILTPAPLPVNEGERQGKGPLRVQKLL
jgi:hypothetical protein